MTHTDPTIGLLGSYSGDWRATCGAALAAHPVRIYDPSHDDWSGINHHNGDQMQARIDTLVAAQHEAIRGLTCAIFHLHAWLDPQQQTPAPAYAARCELGFLTGRGIPTFAHIHPQVTGRNYLWAEMKPYAHMVRCDSLEDALAQALAFVAAAQSAD